jgi:hypothetical protein
MANAQAAFKWNSIVEPGITFTFSDAQTAEPVAYFTTETNSAYLITAKVVAAATDNWDEVNTYIFAGTFENDGGTLTQTSTTTDIHTKEGHAGWACTFAVSSPDVQVVFTTDDTTPVTGRVVLEVIAVRSKSPHFYGTSTNA